MILAAKNIARLISGLTLCVIIAGCEATKNVTPIEKDGERREEQKATVPKKEKLDFVDWEIETSTAGGDGYIQEKEKKSGARAAFLGGDKEKSVFILSDTSLYPVRPGDKVELSAFVKPKETAKDANRIIARFYDKNRKFLKETAQACGVTSDWRNVSLKTVAPTNAAYVTPTIIHYRAVGTCYFDDLRLTINGKDLALKDGGFENAAPPANGAWRFPINLKEKNVHALVDIEDMKVNANLVHYNGPETLQFLAMDLTYNVFKPANCYLTSNLGSQYWYNFNLDSLNQSNVYSREKIDLSAIGRFTITVPFEARDDRYFNPPAKGPNAVRGHHCFYVIDKNDHPLGTTSNVDALTRPEMAFFGEQGAGDGKFYRKVLYTLANLTSYRLEISDFHSDWNANGWFAFKLYVIDADSEKLSINAADIDVRDGKGEKLEAAQAFDRYDIPRGFFIGKLGDAVPEKLTIRAKVLAATPRGKETRSVEKVFARGENFAAKNPLVREETAREPETEDRVIFMCASSNEVDKEPAPGKARIKEIVKKAKQCNFNVISPFAMGNRGWADCSISNPYFQSDFPSWDPFVEFRKATREEGVALHATICVLPEGGETLVGVLRDHPEWAMTDGNGNKKGWLDPAVPEVRAYRLKDIAELMTKYALDGICLDYCRLSGGPSDRGAEIYMKETGIDPRKLSAGSEEYKAWYIWEGNHLSDFVREIRDTMKKINPKAKLGAYVQGVKYAGTGEYREYHQKFTDWLKNGYLDAIYPTGYVYDMLRFKSWCKRQIDACRQANANVPCAPTIGVASSHGALRNSQELIDQIDALRELGADGQSFFRWESLEKWMDVVKEKAYAKPAAPRETKE